MSKNLKISLFLSFIFSVLYIFFLYPFEFADEFDHFLRVTGNIFITDKFYVDESFYLICEQNNCKTPLIEVLIKSFQNQSSLNIKSELLVDLRNIKNYPFTSYIYQKLIVLTLSEIIINPIQIYFFGKLIILTINFILIYFFLKNINNLALKTYIIFILNFPLFLITLGSFSNDMTIIMLSILTISVLLKKNNLLNFFFLNLLILIIAIGKLPYCIFYFIPFLILIKKFDPKFVFVFATFIIIFMLLAFNNINSLEQIIRRPNINFEDHFIYLKENFLQIPMLIFLNFFNNAWTYLFQLIGYYSAENIINYPWSLIVYPFLFTYIFIFIIFVVKNYNHKSSIIIIFTILSILFVALIHWFGFSYPDELSNIYGFSGRYLLINSVFFSYFFIYQKRNLDNFFNKKFYKIILVFVVISNFINLTNLIDVKFF